jgi:NAD(P)-dependent dehydrogenase (short-subunit alcohol dehydrogenase family)
MSQADGSVLITAGAGGAGLAIARAFAKAGKRVAVCDIDAAAVAKAGEEGILAIRADCSLEAEVEAVFRTVEAENGAVQVLVNNVGIAGPTASIENVTLRDWERTLNVNLTGHFLCIRRAVPQMKAARSGLIVNISSASAKVGLPLRAPYVASKGAVVSLSMTLARELGPSGIRVNAILPGAIRGERIKRVIREKAVTLKIETSEYERSLLRYISLRTMVDPEDIAAMAIFLASEAGCRITGQAIGVDGNVEWEE